MLKQRCRECRSTRVIKNGMRPIRRKGKRGYVQAYQCQNCWYQWREGDRRGVEIKK